MKKIFALIGLVTIISCAEDPKPFGPVPTESQLAWQQMEMNLFICLGPNTYTSMEWGTGTESPDIFQPYGLDCKQWTGIAKASGMKGVVLVAKHHDGFCLWPNPASHHTVAQSSWRDGKGDVLRELSDACHEDSLGLGIYISPWDMNDPAYASDEYNDIYLRTLDDALTRYGDVFEEWFDGACGSERKQSYDWDAYHAKVRELQPDAVMFSDVGPGCRWIGNERGIAGRTNWSRLSVDGYEPGASAPSNATLNVGEPDGACWLPGEADVSIRPGWFYHENEDSLVKSVDALLEIYYCSVGRNALLLLNLPPEKSGRISPIDSARMVDFRDALDKIFAVDYAKGATITASEERGNRFGVGNLLDGNYDTYWTVDDSTKQASVVLSFEEPRTFNRVMLMEYIPLGQRVSAFHIEAMDGDGSWKEIAKETTIGYKRIVPVETVSTKSLKIVIDDSRACPVLNGLSLYMDNVYGGSFERLMQ